MFINCRSTQCRLGLVLALSLLYQSLFSQSLFSGLGAEVGAGYNQLFARASLSAPTNSPSKLTRDGFSIIPTVRVKYESALFESVRLTPFVSFNRFGGFQSQPNGYKDEFWFDVLDAGIFASYSFGPYQLGPGIKINRHLRVSGRWFGGANLESNEGQAWREDEVTGWFRRWSSDLSLRGSYRFSNWNVALESWFGISSFQQPSLDGLVNWRQNHFRVLLGYNL